MNTIKTLLLVSILAVAATTQAVSPISGGSSGGDALTANPLSQFAATTSSQLKGVLSDENAPDGASSKFVLALGSLSVASGKTATFSNSITFAGTDTTTMTFPGTSATIARTDAANTFTGHQTIEGVTSTGATGTGNFVFDASPTITGHETIEGVTATGATGTGKFVFDASPTITGHETIEGVTATGATGTGKFVFDASPTFTGVLTTARVKGTAGSYTVTMNGANTASVKTATGSDISGLITLTMSSTGNTSASICTVSGFNWTSAPNAVVITGTGVNAMAAQISTKQIYATSITTTGFDLQAGSAGLVSGTSYTWNWVAFQ